MSGLESSSSDEAMNTEESSASNNITHEQYSSSSHDAANTEESSASYNTTHKQYSSGSCDHVSVKSSDEQIIEKSSSYEDNSDYTSTNSISFFSMYSGSYSNDAHEDLSLSSFSIESSDDSEQYEQYNDGTPVHRHEEEIADRIESSCNSEQNIHSISINGTSTTENIDTSMSVADNYVYPSSQEYSLEELIEDLHEDDNVGDFNHRFQKLRDLIMNEEAREIIDAHCNIDIIEMWLGIMKFSLTNGLTHSATADSCKLINSIFGEKVIGDTRYRIDQLFNPQEGVQFHAVCPDCKMYLGEFNKQMKIIHCDVCEVDVDIKNPSYTDFFIVFDIRHDIKNIIEENKTYFSNIMMNRQEENENLQWSHITDGLKYQEFRRSLPDDKKDTYATSMFNSDGAPVFKSSKFSIWPIQVVVNEIPQHIRNKKTIVHSVWFGHDKPNMTYFLQIFVNSINHYSVSGINCTIGGEEQRIYVYAICCCVDSTARPPMQGIIQFNGYYGCSWCIHPGQRVFHGRGSAIKYTLLDEIPIRRTADETLQHIQDAMNSRFPVYGMKKPSPLLNLNNFNIIDGFVPDPMHCLDLGVAKKFMEYWFKTSNMPYSIPKFYFDQMDEKIKSFKVPTQLMRLSRSLKDWKYWKAKEFENWVLFYSIVLLSEIAEFQEYLQHWSLLVEAYHLLLQDTISIADLQRADRLLKSFVADTEYYYGPHAMTYNIHQLLHLPQSVINWGPLWSHNAYTFEAGNYRILRSVHAAKGVLSQVCRNLSLNLCVQLLQEYVDTLENSPIQDFIYYLENRITQATLKLNENRYFGKSRPLQNIDDLQIMNAGVRAFDRMVRNSNLFGASTITCFRSDNSYAILKYGTYIRIHQFLVNPNNGMEYVVYSKVYVELDNLINEQLTSIRRVALEDDQISTVMIQELDRLCVFMDLNSKQYISAFPNMYW